MSKQFKVGDKVRNVSDGPEKWSTKCSTLGAIYTVAEVRDPSETPDGRQRIKLAELVEASPYHFRKSHWYELVTEPATIYKVISTDYPECQPWPNEYASVEEAEAGVLKGDSGRTFEIYSVVRTVHKTVKLTERTEVIRELEVV